MNPEILACYGPESDDRRPVEVGAALAALLDWSLVVTSVVTSGRSLADGKRARHPTVHARTC